MHMRHRHANIMKREGESIILRYTNKRSCMPTRVGAVDMSLRFHTRGVNKKCGPTGMLSQSPTASIEMYGAKSERPCMSSLVGAMDMSLRAPESKRTSVQCFIAGLKAVPRPTHQKLLGLVGWSLKSTFRDALSIIPNPAMS